MGESVLAGGGSVGMLQPVTREGFLVLCVFLYITWDIMRSTAIIVTVTAYS